MQVSIQADHDAQRDVQRLEQLIAGDRSSAGESRRGQVQAPLQKALYTAPMRVVLKQRWRDERRACVTLLGAVAAAAALLGFLTLAPSPSAGAVNPVPDRESRAELPRRAASLPSPAMAATFAPIAIAGPDKTNAKADEPGRSGHPTLSVRLRLQRADLWLRIGTPRAAREARQLLESALGEQPDSAHGQAALAQACLILEDQGCARHAIDEAQRVRPWRAGYRSLSRHIERAFDTQP